MASEKPKRSSSSASVAVACCDYHGRPLRARSGKRRWRRSRLRCQSSRRSPGGSSRHTAASGQGRLRVFGWRTNAGGKREIGRHALLLEFGENLTTEGMELNDALVGERGRSGPQSVSEPPNPLLAARSPDVYERFHAASATLRPGTYLRIVVEGDLGAGDEIRVMAKPDHDLTIQISFASICAIVMRCRGCLRFRSCPT